MTREQIQFFTDKGLDPDKIRWCNNPASKPRTEDCEYWNQDKYGFSCPKCGGYGSSLSFYYHKDEEDLKDSYNQYQASNFK